MDYTDLLTSIAFNADQSSRVTVPEDWMQGRTTYGGLTAALCLKAALPLAGDRPLRSAQVAFVGPASGELVSVPTILREGKNTAFISVRMHGPDGVVAECIFAFGTARDSSLDFSNMAAPSVTLPDETPQFFPDATRRPAFSHHFNVRLAKGGRPISGAPDGEIVLWLRHRDEKAPMDAVTLLSIADSPRRQHCPC